MRVFGLRETIDPSRESIGNCKGFFLRIWQSFDVRPNMHFQRNLLLQGTLGGKGDIFAASSESTAWVLLWETLSRPIGVRVCPVAQLNFFGTAFDPRAWTLVVFWKESSGRQPKPITLENEGEDNTNYLSPPNYAFFDDPEVPFGPQGPQPPAPPEPHEPPGSLGRMASSSTTCWWKRRSGNRKYIAWAITFATFTDRTSTYSRSNEWLRRWWWSATTRKETTKTV